MKSMDNAPRALVAVAILSLVGCGDDETGPTPNPTGGDDGVPRVTSSTPAEGASDVEPTLSEIQITFSELMDTSAGSLSIEGGATLGTPSWSGQTLTVSVNGLSGEGSYSIALTGFIDRTGTPLDPVAYLEDGALDFGTAPDGGDTEAPTVTDTDPNEGQLDVPLGLDAVSVVFNEPMDASITTATLEGGAGPVELTGTWEGDATVLSFAIPGPLAHTSDYRIDLSGFSDLAGNPLDPSVYIGDGALDFTTVSNPDVQPPHAVSSVPAEKAFNLDPLLSQITVIFSEAMDPSHTDVPLTQGSGAPAPVTGVWSDGDTTFTIDLPGFLETGVIHKVDLTGLTDLAGNPLDDAHAYLEDGILDFATGTPDGESCTGPLVVTQATENAGAYTWTVAAGAVDSADGVFACDPNNAGNDVVIRFDKTTDTVANGGELLHVSAVGGTDDINLEITSGNCSAAAGVVERCLWFKESWDTFLDVPAGTYWIWVSDDDTSSGFPGATVTVEEIPPTAPQAEGEGCFAPYTTASAIYTAPATALDSHVWTIPSTINGFDISPGSSAVGSISCDDHATYGDIHGVDAVIEFDKLDPASTLLVEVQNLDPTLSQSDLDVEVLSGCDTLAPATTSLYCGANADTFTFNSAGPAGPVYVWVATEATGEEFNGAEVKIREYTPALGETRTNPEPLTMSGPITPTSTAGADRPSCFPTTGNIHWYSYVTTGTLFGVQGDAAAPIAVVQPNGVEVACSTDTTQVAIGSRVTAGSTVIIAVESPTAIQNLTIIDQTYTGVGDTVTDLGITFPVSATLEYSMAVGTNEVFMGYGSEIWAFPKAGNAVAVEHNSTTDGLTSAMLGYDIAFADGKLFSVDSTTVQSNNRLFAVYDEATTTWGPVAWDIPAAYSASFGVRSMTSDATSLILAKYSSSASTALELVTIDPTASPATPISLGTNSGVYYVTGIAADASYFYVVGRTTGAVEGVYRLDRSNLSAPPVTLALVNASTTRTNIVVDNVGSAQNLYIRDDDAVLHVIANPGTAPIHLGGILSGNGNDVAMTFDPSEDKLYLFDSTLAANGGVVVVE